MVSINKETRDTIISEAMTLMIDGLLTPTQSEDGLRYHITDDITLNAIVDVISDNGMTYITTASEIKKLWDSLLEADPDNQVVDWLTQTTIAWEIISFGSGVEYDNWIEHLIRAYGRFHPSSDTFKSGNKATSKDICANKEHVDRLPIDSEYRQYLHANPWMVYLLTLQLDIARVVKLMLGGGDNKRDSASAS